MKILDSVSAPIAFTPASSNPARAPNSSSANSPNPIHPSQNTPAFPSSPAPDTPGSRQPDPPAGRSMIVPHSYTYLVYSARVESHATDLLLPSGNLCFITSLLRGFLFR